MAREPRWSTVVPRGRAERRQVADNCGARRCFLGPRLSFPTCPKCRRNVCSCTPHCGGLLAAFKRARQTASLARGASQRRLMAQRLLIARKAVRRAAQAGCSWPRTGKVASRILRTGRAPLGGDPAREADVATALGGDVDEHRDLMRKAFRGSLRALDRLHASRKADCKRRLRLLMDASGLALVADAHRAEIPRTATTRRAFSNLTDQIVDATEILERECLRRRR